MRVDVPAVIGCAMSDVLSSFQIGGASVTGALVQSAVASFIRRQSEATRDILLEEFSLGHIDRIEVASQDELGGILFRYFNAIRDNAARLNLRLMAQVMVGLVQRDRLYADEFTKYANALATLSRDEVIVLTECMKFWTECQQRGPLKVGEFREGLHNRLVPSAYPFTRNVDALLSSGSRSGLLFISGGGGIGGPIFFYPSPMFEAVFDLADFQDALRREGVSVT
jgi:hypothetical protein